MNPIFPILVGILTLLMTATSIYLYFTQFELVTKTIKSDDLILNNQVTDEQTNNDFYKTFETVTSLSTLQLGTSNPLTTEVWINAVEQPTPTNVLPIINIPGLNAFADTVSSPLVTPPEGMFYADIDKDSSQLITSFQNGYHMFSQYKYTDVDSDTVFRFVPTHDVYASGINRIFDGCTDISTTSTFPTGNNTKASAVGSIGYKSVCISTDGSRLYIGFRHPSQGGNSAESSEYEFQQTVGGVATYIRSGDSWIYSCSLSMRNPFGSLSSSFRTELLQGVYIKNDMFGRCIQTTVDQNTQDKIVAVSGYINRNDLMVGTIFIMTEQSDQTMKMSGMISMDSVPNASTTFNREAYLNFGKWFDIQDDTCVVSIPTNDILVVFLKNQITLQWEYSSLIPSPTESEDFGTSFKLSHNNTFLLIGSPTKPIGITNAGEGGSVYIYIRTDENEFVFSDKVSNVGGFKRAFGYWVNMNKTSQYITVSANQDNRLIPQLKTSLIDDLTSRIVVMTIDQTNFQFIESTKKYIKQYTRPGLQSYPDPLFGLNCPIATDTKGGKIVIVANEPMNQLAQWYFINK